MAALVKQKSQQNLPVKEQMKMTPQQPAGQNWGSFIKKSVAAVTPQNSVIQEKIGGETIAKQQLHKQNLFDRNTKSESDIISNFYGGDKSRTGTGVPE